ncbi:aminodeoxychorismate/anthranilate synthase component II [Fulvivirga sp.]|uniref:anthranilate synthase component II n=2 Tax=Fulvivirga sp. TaxID=1931237 RepID=UPI0032EB0132
MGVLLLDNFDSFTFNLVDYFLQLGVKCDVVRNNVGIDVIEDLKPTALIISPGPEIPLKAGCLMEVLSMYAEKIPILGICLGHQAIGEYYGMNLIKAPHPRHGKITSISHLEDDIFKNIPEIFNAVQYNSLILDNRPNANIDIIATANNGQVMAIKHNKLPVWGLQFHPEAALTEHGLRMLKNWVDYNKLGV